MLTDLTRRQSYISGMVLAFQTTQLILGGDPRGCWFTAYDLLGKIVDQLGSCHDNAPLTLQFAQTLSRHYACLREVAEELPSDPGNSLFSSEANEQGSTALSPSTYLFTTPTEASHLHRTSDELLTQLCDL